MAVAQDGREQVLVAKTRTTQPDCKTEMILRALAVYITQFHSPHFAGLSEETLKAVGPFYLVSMPGEVKDPIQGNRKTWGGLTESMVSIYINPYGRCISYCQNKLALITK